MIQGLLIAVLSANLFAFDLISLKFLQKRVKNVFLETFALNFTLFIVSSIFIIFNTKMTLFFDLKFLLFSLIINILNFVSIIYLFKSFKNIEVSLTVAIANINVLSFIFFQAIFFQIYPSPKKLVILFLLVINLLYILCGRDIFKIKFLKQNILNKGFIYALIVMALWGLINLLIFYLRDLGYNAFNITSFSNILGVFFSLGYLYLKKDSIKLMNNKKHEISIVNNREDNREEKNFSGLSSKIIRLIQDPKVLLFGFLSSLTVFLGFVSSIFAINHLNKIYVVPILNLQVIFVMIYSEFIFKEQISIERKFGIILEFVLLTLFILI